MQTIEGALRRLNNRDAIARKAAFPIPTTTFSTQRRKDALKNRDRRRAKYLIKPENAQRILDKLPICESDELHAIICGDFVFCDLIAAIAEQLGPVNLRIATLSMSRKNIDALERLIEAGSIASLQFIISHYFRSTNKQIFATLESKLGQLDQVRIHVTRSHCKIALFEFENHAPVIIEGSANLRSSGNFEQLSIFAAPALHHFYCAWFDQIGALPA